MDDEYLITKVMITPELSKWNYQQVKGRWILWKLESIRPSIYSISFFQLALLYFTILYSTRILKLDNIISKISDPRIMTPSSELWRLALRFGALKASRLGIYLFIYLFIYSFYSGRGFELRSPIKPPASSLKPQASSLKPQASSLKPQASSLKPQASSLSRPSFSLVFLYIKYT